MNLADDFSAIRKKLDEIEAEKRAELEKKPVEETAVYNFYIETQPVFCGWKLGIKG